MKKYFIYELKKSIFVMCALAVIATAVYVISVVTQVDDVGFMFRFNDFSFGAIAALGGAFSVLVPIWKLSYRMKKRSLDLYYSLPLSHVRILAVKLSVGLIVLFASFTVAFWIGGFTAMAALSKYEYVYTYFKSVNFIPLYFSMLVPMLVIYALTAFIFTRANRLVDGILFVVMTSMALGAVGDAITMFMYNNDALFDIYLKHSFASLNFTPFGALDIIAAHFGRNMFKNASKVIEVTAIDWVGLSFVAAIGIAAGIGLFFAERRVKAENCEQISESFFGYKVMIPLYAFCFAITFARVSYVLVALIAAAAYAVSVLYKRTPKIGWKFALVVGVAFLAGVGLSFLQYA